MRQTCAKSAPLKPHVFWASTAHKRSASLEQRKTKKGGERVKGGEKRMSTVIKVGTYNMSLFGYKWFLPINWSSSQA